MVTTPNQPGALEPGWHPDPWGEGRIQRWWDGRQWTSATRPNPAAQPKQRKRRSVVFPLSFATFVLAAIVIAIAMNRSDVDQVSVGGMTVKFSSKQITAEQPAMQEKAASAAAEAQAAPAAQQDTNVSFAGNWKLIGNPLLTWRITQYGASVALTETVEPYGTTAVGQGSVSGERLVAQLQLINGSVARADMGIQSDGSLSGTVTNLTSGITQFASFHR